MTIYRPTTGISLYATRPITNTSYAYDNNSGTAATASQTGVGGRAADYADFPSVSGITSITLYVDWEGASTGGESLSGQPYTGSVSLLYWNGSSWINLDYFDIDTGDKYRALTPYAITIPSNLNSLKVRAGCYGSQVTETDPETQRITTIKGTASISIYEIYVDASAGPTYGMNAISGSTYIAPAVGSNYSTTVTNDSTNNCTWSIRSGGGSLSGATSDSTNTRVTYTPPWNAQTTVIRVTSNLNTGAYSEITVSNPGVTVTSISGPTGVYCGYSGAYSATVSYDGTNSCTWSIVSGGGTLSGAANDTNSSRVTWTAPTSVSGQTAVLRCTSNRDSGVYSNINVSVPTVGVALTAGPSQLRASTAGTYTVTVTGNPDTRVQWSATGGSFSTTLANSTVWTAPSTPGKYTISGYHVYETSKTFSYDVFIDFCVPTTYSYGTATPAICDIYVSSPELAYNLNSNDYGYAQASYTGSSIGIAEGYLDFFGFPSLVNLTSLDIVLDGYSNGCSVKYSVDSGQTWIWCEALPTHPTPTTITVIPGTVFNMNQFRVRFVLSTFAETGTWDRWTNTFTMDIINADCEIYEIRAYARGRGYTAATGTSNRGYTPTPLYMPSKFSALTGVQGGADTTPASIGSGVGAIPFFLYAIPG